MAPKTKPPNLGVASHLLWPWCNIPSKKLFLVTFEWMIQTDDVVFTDMVGDAVKQELLDPLRSSPPLFSTHLEGSWWLIISWGWHRVGTVYIYIYINKYIWWHYAQYTRRRRFFRFGIPWHIIFDVVVPDNFMMNRTFPSRFTPRNLPQNPDWRIEVDKNHHDEYPRKWTNECPLKRKHVERKFHLRRGNPKWIRLGTDQANTEVKARTLLYTWYISGMYGVPQKKEICNGNPIKMDDLGGKPTIFGNTHI